MPPDSPSRPFTQRTGSRLGDRSACVSPARNPRPTASVWGTTGGKWDLATNAADQRYDAELARNATLSPKTAATAPPTTAPSDSIVDHVTAVSELAATRWSARTRPGVTAVRAGSKKAERVIWRAVAAYTIQIWSRQETRSSARTTAARPRSAPIITAFRDRRSTTRPARGLATKTGSICMT